MNIATATVYSADELDAAVGVVLTRHPDLTGPDLIAKARRLAALHRHAHHASTWRA